MVNFDLITDDKLAFQMSKTMKYNIITRIMCYIIITVLRSITFRVQAYGKKMHFLFNIGRLYIYIKTQQKTNIKRGLKSV